MREDGDWKQQRRPTSESAGDTRTIDEQAAKFGTLPVDYIYEQPGPSCSGKFCEVYGVEIFHALLEVGRGRAAAP